MRELRRGSLTILGALGLVLLAVAVGAGLTAGAGAIEWAFGSAASFGEGVASVSRSARLVALIQLGALMTAALAGVTLVHGPEARYRKALALEPVATPVLALAVLTGLALHFPLVEITNLGAALMPSLAPDVTTQVAMQRLVRIESSADALFVPLTVVAIPALSEELLFRGVLLPGLARRHGERIGLAVSAVLFGLIHVEPLTVGAATLAGWLLGHVRLRTGSVIPTIAVHGAFNAVPVLLPAGLLRIEGFNTVSRDVQHLPLLLVLGTAAVVAVCVVMIGRVAEADDD